MYIEERVEALISIHAPAKGATANHRIADLEELAFQSTLPRRERRYLAGACKRDSKNFNPRSREGSDMDA